MWPDRVSNPGPLTYGRMPYRLRYAARHDNMPVLEIFQVTLPLTHSFLVDSSILINRPFSHCLCACVYRSRGALFLDNRRDFTEMGQTDFKPLILSM